MHAEIRSYEADIVKLRGATSGLTIDQLCAAPIPGKWSILQCIVHLLDADLVWTHRMKCAIAEESPAVNAYDESRFSQNLRYDLWDPGEALTIFELNRRNFARVLRALHADGWQRSVRHEERGDMTVAQMFRHILPHVDHHLRFIEEKRKILLR